MTKIELKNIKYAAFASEETHCYEATLYVNGKRFAHVSNDGHGGCDRQEPIKPYTYKDLAQLEKTIAKEYPFTPKEILPKPKNLVVRSGRKSFKIIQRPSF